MTSVTIRNLKELHAFAKRFADSLKGGEIIGLVGDLGAGKTAFVQAACAALGVREPVRSPTFILMQLFETGPKASRRGIGTICHVDAYRLKEERELFAIGFDEYAGAGHIVTFVEWADRTPSLHGRDGYSELTFEFTETEGERIVRVDGAAVGRKANGE